MKHSLNVQEARVIGCLLEKQVTTPEQYPMSLNGVTVACNQKTNREPVMELSESDVQQTLDFLLKKHHIRTQSGNRVMKYEHRFCNSEFGNLKFSPAELAVITTLLLRGAQTPGELRTRTNRMYEFADVAETEEVLNQLSLREDGPFVVRLARDAGKRESRFMHLFSGDIAPVSAAEENAVGGTGGLEARVAQLEQQVIALTRRLDEVLLQLDD
ncbi:YceH family protein [Yersinia pekkanenii]|uniref:Oxidoreductase n=1 Tax=Yersinia pekkanenii TaxID=1288385 RepID=A0A0T9Q4E0_9GAMM|nr:YceH family protein [Yersinia pekkanenii]CNH95535.1 putative oxidoreductase [Yersinia pekkanenii]CRY64476.1 putative oxidoreductase [Yersinia pekkanenii]